MDFQIQQNPERNGKSTEQGERYQIFIGKLNWVELGFLDSFTAQLNYTHALNSWAIGQVKVYSKFQTQSWVVRFFSPFLCFSLVFFWVFQVNGFGGLWPHSVESMSQGKLQTLVFEGMEKVGTFFGVRCVVWFGR